MPHCFLCDSQATETVDHDRKLVTWECPKCQQYTLIANVDIDLKKQSDWQELRPRLARAVRWSFYYQGAGLVALQNVLDAERLVLRHEEFEEELAQEEAVAALVDADPSKDPLDAEHMRKLGRAVGLSVDDARGAHGNSKRTVSCGSSIAKRACRLKICRLSGSSSSGSAARRRRKEREIKKARHHHLPAAPHYQRDQRIDQWPDPTLLPIGPSYASPSTGRCFSLTTAVARLPRDSLPASY